MEKSLSENVENCVQFLAENECENKSSNYRSKLLIITENIKSDNSKLLQVVELLAEPLTDAIIVKRCAGTCFLTDILETLENDFLQEKDLNYFVDFFCDRLNDHHLVMPHAVNGLYVLSSYKNLPEGSAKQILRMIFKEVHNQSQLHSIRFSVYRICSNFLLHRFSEVHEMGQEFVFGYIQIMDGEKDPRNLVLVFDTVYFIIKHLPLEPYVEELFEVIACYFPIEFTPPPDAPHGITREALIKGLRQCLASTSSFAPFCLPLLLEKLDSDITDAKIDALQTLIMCTKVYSAESLRPFCHSLWSSIRREMFLSMSESVQELALKTITDLVKAFSSSIIKIDSVSCLEDFLEEILKECKKYLCEPELKLIHPSAKILLAAATASNSACYLVLTNTIPLLLDQFNHHFQNNCQGIILEIINDFLEAFIKTSSDISDDVNYNYSDLLVTYFSVLTGANENLYPIALKGFYIFLSKNNLISTLDCEKLCNFLIKFILNYTKNSIQVNSILLLERLSKLHPQIIQELVFPLLKNIIEEDTSSLDLMELKQIENVNNIKYYNTLIALSAICFNESLMGNVVNLLINHIKILSANTISSSLKKITGCIECILKIIQLQKENKKYLLNSIFFPLLDLIISGALNSLPSILQDKKIILSVAKVLGEITSLQSEDHAENLIKEMEMIFLHSKSNFIMINSDCFYPLKLGSPSAQIQLVFLLEAVVCFMTRTIHLSNEIINQLEVLSLKSTDEAISEAAIRIIATAINKLPDDPNSLQLIIKFKHNLLELINKSNHEEQRNAFILWIWLTKALVIRSHPLMDDFLQVVLELLKNNTLQKLATEAFSIISEEYSGMSTESQANISVLYRQKLFVKTIPHLIVGFNETHTKSQQLYYLTAITCLLRSLPFHVLSSEFDSLLPILIQALSFDDTTLLNTALITLNIILCENPGVISKYLTSLYSHFIHLSQEGSTMKVRMNALDCLNSMTLQEISLIVPIKIEVIRGLAQCLDDKKRLVRQKAVSTRGNWFLVGAPAGK